MDAEWDGWMDGWASKVRTGVSVCKCVCVGVAAASTAAAVGRGRMNRVSNTHTQNWPFFYDCCCGWWWREEEEEGGGGGTCANGHPHARTSQNHSRGPSCLDRLYLDSVVRSQSNKKSLQCNVKRRMKRCAQIQTTDTRTNERTNERILSTRRREEEEEEEEKPTSSSSSTDD